MDYRPTPILENCLFKADIHSFLLPPTLVFFPLKFAADTQLHITSYINVEKWEYLYKLANNKEFYLI